MGSPPKSNSKAQNFLSTTVDPNRNFIDPAHTREACAHNPEVAPFRTGVLQT